MLSIIDAQLESATVAMPSGKRDTEKKGNTPVNTGPSPNSDGRANTQVEEADEPARGSGPLHLLPSCQINCRRRRPTTNNCCASLDNEDEEEEQSYRKPTGT
ncbi:hypothetical protein T12_81 [Trichinella patagoniensis]|uniref:Uncharacterized protein n=1 Tax=Trichinella patagoniensis TaxID=990121 RepID=A0A0V1AHS4_9BILA|nr:hypothetical protein T12_81 [Trichinella patagoniensis]